MFCIGSPWLDSPGCSMLITLTLKLNSLFSGSSSSCWRSTDLPLASVGSSLVSADSIEHELATKISKVLPRFLLDFLIVQGESLTVLEFCWKSNSLRLA